MSNALEHIIRTTIKDILSEQDSNVQANVFNDAHKKFLGTFAAAGSKHLGIIYSVSEIGIREFVSRSGTQYNCTPEILLSLLRGKYIKIVPYTGYGRDTDYTIELQLPLESVQQYASLAASKDKNADGEAVDVDTSTSSGGGGGSFGGGGGGLPPLGDTGGDAIGDIPGDDAAAAPAEGEPAVEDTPETPEEPDVEVAHVVKYGDLLKESVKITKQLMSEASKSKKKSSKVKDVKIYSDKSRILKRLPKGYIYHLKQIIKTLTKRTYNAMDKERLIADILDNVQINFNLNAKQMHRSYEFHRNQKRLQKFLDKD